MNAKVPVRYYPVSFNISNRKCVVVGGGAIAARKVRSLLSGDARVVVVSPALGAGMGRLARAGKIAHRCASYRRSHLQGAALVIAATGDCRVNAAVARDAAVRRIPVNVVDAPALSTFIVPAVFTRGQITVSVSTNGVSPFLARRLKERLGRFLGPEYAEYCRLCAAARREIRRRTVDRGLRRAACRRVACAPLAALLKNGRRRQAKALVRRIIEGETRAD